MQWLGTSKYTIFLIILKLQKLWNLIYVLLKSFLWKYLFEYSNDFSKFIGSNKINVHGVPSDTTQGWVYLFTYVVNVIKLNMCIVICSKNIHLVKLVVQWLMTWFLNMKVRSWIPHICNLSHYHSPKWCLAH